MDYRKLYSYHMAGLSMRRNSKKLKLNLGVQGQITSLTGKLSTSESAIGDQYMHILPNMSLNYEIGGGQTLDVNYFTTVSPPELEQLMPFTNNTNPNFSIFLLILFI